MDTNTKYKRWGWGALIGLIGVILICGLVVAINMTAPKKTVAPNDNTGSSIIAGNKGDDKKTDNKKEDSKKEDSKKDDSKTESDKKNDATKPSADNGASAGTTNGGTNGGSSSASEMPKTGPVDNMISIMALATIAGLAAYNFGFVKKNA